MVFSLWTPDVERETNELIALLHVWGIHYLVGDGNERVPVHAEQRLTSSSAARSLIQRLVKCKDARVRDAFISLLLLHPELTEVVLAMIYTDEEPIVTRLHVLILATLYMQRLWSIRLMLAFGHPSCLQESRFQNIWRHDDLPAPACYQGMQGLLALQHLEQERIGFPIAVIGDWQNQIQHLLVQEEAKLRPVQEHIFPILTNTGEQDRECDTMSMRPTVDKAEIERFLRQFGQQYRKASRLYLTGGAALVHAGIRTGRTLDIDVEVTDGDMLLTIDQLKHGMHLNVKLASPRDFLPVPTQWETMSQYVGRYGMVDVFYFDFYSVALSKIERGTTRDLQDVQLLVQQRVIDLPTLDLAFQDVMAQVQTPQERMRYTLIRQQLALL